MGWVYLDDQFPDHPKVAAAGGDAAWLFVCGLAYCRRYNTAGAVPSGQVTKLTDRKNPARLAATLVEVGLWEETDGGFVVHDYSDWNRASESRSEAGRKGAAARWQSQPGRNGNRNASASSGHMAQDAQFPIPIPNPPPPPPPVTHEGRANPGEEEDSVGKALQMLAERDLAARSPRSRRIADVDAWLTKAVETRRRRHADQLAGLAGLTVDEIVAALDGSDEDRQAEAAAELRRRADDPYCYDCDNTGFAGGDPTDGKCGCGRLMTKSERARATAK